MRKEYQPGVLAPSQKSASEIAAHEAFNREHPAIEGLSVPLLAASQKANGSR